MTHKSLMIGLILFSLTAIESETKTITCSCLKVPTAKEAFQGADVVFLGIPVLAKLREKVLADVQGRKIVNGHVEVKFRVLKSWKGVTTGYVWVSSEAQESACGYPFYLAHTYLVYARGKHTLETSSCDRTALENDALRDLKELGSARKIFNQEKDEEE